MQIVISGSFRKHMNEIIELKQRLVADGIEVIKPNNIDVVYNPEFIKFKGEENIGENYLQMQYFRAIDFCDAHIIYNKDGYIDSNDLNELFYGTGRISFAKNNENEPNDDFRRIYGMINVLIQMGNIKFCLDTMYEDFKVKQKIKGR